MPSTSQFARIAQLAGEPARAVILFALMDQRALTAGELAIRAGVTPPTASGHLRQLADAGLVAVHQQGRHRYFALASPEVAQMIEAIGEVAGGLASHPKPRSVGTKEQALRRARTCYDHLAGELGVGLAEALHAAGHIEIAGPAAMLTPSGLTRFGEIGVDTAPIEARMARRSGRILCRACLDWTERRPHVAGLVGQVLFEHSLHAGWVRRRTETRALEITAKGQSAYRELFGLELWGAPTRCSEPV